MLTEPSDKSSDHAVLTRPTGLYVDWIKPAIDRLVAGCLLIVFSPLIAAVALAVRISLGSPVLYRQRRVGLDGTTFDVLKFRSMGPDRRVGRATVAEDRRRTHKTTADPRHTDFGRFLRRWSLDELPQLWNIARGDMSLVGPRPELVEVVERYEPWQHQRHLVKPGLTGLWQVSKRGDGPMHLYTDVDLDYVRTIGPLTDFRILLKTIPAALSRSGS